MLYSRFNIKNMNWTWAFLQPPQNLVCKFASSIVYDILCESRGNNGNSINLATGLVYVWSFTLTTAVLTLPSELGITEDTVPTLQSALGSCSSTMSTTVPIARFSFSRCHFCRVCKVGKKSRTKCFQKWSLRTWLCLHRFLLSSSVSG